MDKKSHTKSNTIKHKFDRLIWNIRLNRQTNKINIEKIADKIDDLKEPSEWDKEKQYTEIEYQKSNKRLSAINARIAFFSLLILVVTSALTILSTFESGKSFKKFSNTISSYEEDLDRINTSLVENLGGLTKNIVKSTKNSKVVTEKIDEKLSKENFDTLLKYRVYKNEDFNKERIKMEIAAYDLSNKYLNAFQRKRSIDYVFSNIDFYKKIAHEIGLLGFQAFRVNDLRLDGYELADLITPLVDLNHVNILSLSIGHVEAEDVSIKNSKLIKTNIDGLDSVNLNIERYDLKNITIKSANLLNFKSNQSKISGVKIDKIDVKSVNAESSELNFDKVSSICPREFNLKGSKIRNLMINCIDENDGSFFRIYDIENSNIKDSKINFCGKMVFKNASSLVNASIQCDDFFHTQYCFH